MKYKVGDKVRVRQWDDMLEEFGEYITSTSIDIQRCLFTKEMREYCGEIVTIKEIKGGNSYYIIKEDNEAWYWVDEMFEEICSESNDSIYAEGTMLKVIKTGYGCYGAEGKIGIVTSKLSTRGLVSSRKGFNISVSPDEIWRINVDATVKTVKLKLISPNPKYNDMLDTFTKIPKGEIKITAEETEEMMKENKTVEAKKEVHPKDEDHLKRVEKIQKKIDYYKREFGFEKIEEVVPEKILNIKIKEGVATIFGYEGKIVCDERDKFSMEYALYLALAKCDYGKKYTTEGIEKKAGELKFERCYVNKVEKAKKLLAAMEELEKENAEYEALLEARRQKRWERKQRQMDRRAEKKRLQEEKEREEKFRFRRKHI